MPMCLERAQIWGMLANYKAYRDALGGVFAAWRDLDRPRCRARALYWHYWAWARRVVCFFLYLEEPPMLHLASPQRRVQIWR